MLFVLDFIDLTLVTKRVTANPTTVKYSYNVMKNIERWYNSKARVKWSLSKYFRSFQGCAIGNDN